MTASVLTAEAHCSPFYLSSASSRCFGDNVLLVVVVLNVLFFSDTIEVRKSGGEEQQDSCCCCCLYIESSLKAEAQNRLTTSAAKNLAQCYARGIKVLPDLADAKNRMEQLKKYKASNSLIDMLKLLEE